MKYIVTTKGDLTTTLRNNGHDHAANPRAAVAMPGLCAYLGRGDGGTQFLIETTLDSASYESVLNSHDDVVSFRPVADGEVPLVKWALGSVMGGVDPEEH